MQQATLLFLVEANKVLLAMKKRGFGEGLWNGVGGKPNKGELIEDAAIRECQEEINVTPLHIIHVADLKFTFDGKADWSQEVTVYLCHTWRGNPEETEEMSPKWFDVVDIPYAEMWEDDKFWLPEILSGNFVKASFDFGSNQKLRKKDVNSSPL